MVMTVVGFSEDSNHVSLIVCYLVLAVMDMQYENEHDRPNRL